MNDPFTNAAGNNFWIKISAGGADRRDIDLKELIYGWSEPKPFRTVAEALAGNMPSMEYAAGPAIKKDPDPVSMPIEEVMQEVERIMIEEVFAPAIEGKTGAEIVNQDRKALEGLMTNGFELTFFKTEGDQPRGLEEPITFVAPEPPSPEPEHKINFREFL